MTTIVKSVKCVRSVKFNKSLPVFIPTCFYLGMKADLQDSVAYLHIRLPVCELAANQIACILIQLQKHPLVLLPSLYQLASMV